MNEVEFDESQSIMSKQYNVVKKERGIIGFLIKFHIVKNRKWANIVLFLFSLVVLVLSVRLIYQSSISSEILPYSKIPETAKSKLPESVQILYSKKK